MKSPIFFVILLLLAAIGCSSETASNKDPRKFCRVHGDSLIQGVVRADFLVGMSSDSGYMRIARERFPNTRNILFPNGGEKGTVFLHCPTCDSLWKAFRYTPQQ